MLPNCSVVPGQSHATKTLGSLCLGLAKNLCRRGFKIEKQLHWDSPTLSNSEDGVQLYKDSSWLETFLTVVDDHDVLSALLHPALSTKHCRTTFLDIGSYWWSHLPCLLEQTLHARIGKLHNSLRVWDLSAILTWFGQHVKAMVGVLATAACKQLLGDTGES